MKCVSCGRDTDQIMPYIEPMPVEKWKDISEWTEEDWNKYRLGTYKNLPCCSRECYIKHVNKVGEK